MPVDLDAYFNRIRWGGPTTPGFATLAGILHAHMSAIPFENIDVLLGRGIRLDLEGLQAKLVDGRRGGYCFEQSSLLQAVLAQIGFVPTAHMGRVVMMTPRTVAPRSHMILTIPLPEGTFLVDPGFGALAPRIPVPVVAGQEAQIDHETHWLERDENYWTLRMRAQGKVADCWVTTFEVENAADFVVANHYTATHPESPFVNRLMLRALTPDGRVSLHNRDATIVRDGVSETLELSDRAALREFLATYFKFDFPELDTLRVPTVPEWV